MFKKIILSVLVVLILFSGSVRAASASWYAPSFGEFRNKVFDESSDEIFGERYTFAQITWIGWSLIAMLVGPETLPVDQTSLSNDNLDGIGSGGALGVLEYLMAFFYKNPPASGVGYVRDVANRLRIVKPAYAQTGFGFDSLKMFQGLWRATRNISYLLIVIVILFVAFSVMFRSKINPQVVVSIQSSIPKIIWTLILITFSYAIAGFFIDLMYLIFFLFVYGLDTFGALPGTPPTDLVNNFLNQDIFGALLNGPVGGVGIAAGLGALALTLSGFGIALVPILLAIVIGVITFAFKIIVMLAQTYISLLINIVAAPIILLAEAVPQFANSTMGWLRQILADITIFLAVGLAFIFDDILNGAIDNASGPLWGPPYVNSQAWLLKLFISLGVIFILPSVRPVVYQMFQKKSLSVETPRDFQDVSRQISEAFSKIRGRERGGRAVK